jgi:hypothetical protein
VSLLPRLLLVSPADIDCVADRFPIFVCDPTNEENLNIVLDCHEFGVVDSGLAGQLLAYCLDMHRDRAKSQLWLVFERVRISPMLVDDTVLGRLGSRLVATFPTVCQDRSADYCQCMRSMSLHTSETLTRKYSDPRRSL